MRTVEHRLILKSAEDVGVHAPPEPLGRILQSIVPLTRQAVRMAFERRSHFSGHLPSWLLRASNLSFEGISGARETILHFQAPLLGEAASHLYQQIEIEYPDDPFGRPLPEKTGLDLLTAVVADVAGMNANSARYDQSLLNRLHRLGRVLNASGTYQEMVFTGQREESHKARLNPETLAYAEQLKAETPSPEPVRLVGRLDMIRDSTQSFAIQLDDGQEVPGALLHGEMASLRDLFRRRILVVGLAIFRPSGRLLRVDADAIRSAEGEASYWSRMPVPRGMRRSLRTDLCVPQGATSGATALYGNWPGDESEEELLQALRAMD